MEVMTSMLRLLSLCLLICSAISLDDKCPTTELMDQDLILSFPKVGATEAKTVTVPPVPKAGDDYSYATDEAIVVIPQKCFEKFETHIDDHAVLDDRQPCGPKGMAYFRITDLNGGYTTLTEMLQDACSEGLVLNLHGSGGPGWGTVAYAAMMSGMGYVIIMPDSQVMPESMGLKGRLPAKNLSDINLENFCGSFSAYEGKCSGFNKPLCYTSKVDYIVADSVRYRAFVERIYLVRKYELDHFVTTQKMFLEAAKKVFLLGNSEGGMVAARYHHPELDGMMTGRIVAAFACDYNYFVSCPEHAKICGDACNKDVPQLNLIGDADSYFAKTNSIAQKVAANPNGYGTITGNCAARYAEQNFTKATTVVFSEGVHGPMYTHDSEMRNIFADFLMSSNKAPSTWNSLKECSKDDDGVYTCSHEGERPCNTDYTENTDYSWCEPGGLIDSGNRFGLSVALAGLVLLVSERGQ